MPHVPVDPLLPSTSINELRNAVARWDEGGANMIGAREGYRIAGRFAANALMPGTFETVEADATGEQLDRLVRLLLAASAIRNARRVQDANMGSK